MFPSWLTCTCVAPLGFLCKYRSPLIVTTESLFCYRKSSFKPAQSLFQAPLSGGGGGGGFRGGRQFFGGEGGGGLIETARFFEMGRGGAYLI